MAITDYKITDNEINTYNVKSAPDTLNSNAQSNKNWFDRLGEFFISKYNSLLDFIQGDFINVDEVGAGLTYENSLEWKHALHKNVMIANYSGNITAITTGYRTIIANVTGLTTDDFMDCIMNINGTDYQCADAYESGDYATTTCNVEGVEVTITYSLSGGDITLTHTQNPLDTLYWNIQMFSTVAAKIPAKSLPGNISNNAYIAIDPITIEGYTISHADSGITQGKYGPDEDQYPQEGGTFIVPYFITDSHGHLVSAGERTVTLPAGGGGGGGGGSTVLDFYPVGSYYETSDTTFNPNTAWGGTWVLETAGQFHVSAGTGYAAGSTGGSADAIVPYHRHSVAKVTDAITGGAHTHDIENRAVYSGNSNYTALVKGGVGTSTNAALSKTHTHDLPAHNTDYEGTSGTGANMPPYIAVNRWHRTA